MKRTSFYWGGIFYLFSSLSAIAATPKTPNKAPVITPANGVNSFDDYQKQCLAKVKEQGFVDNKGLVNDLGKDICKCAMTEFRSKYNLKQFKELVEKSKTDKTAKSKLTKVGQNCFEDILYDDNTDKSK